MQFNQIVTSINENIPKWIDNNFEFIEPKNYSKETMLNNDIYKLNLISWNTDSFIIKSKEKLPHNLCIKYHFEFFDQTKYGCYISLEFSEKFHLIKDFKNFLRNSKKINLKSFKINNNSNVLLSYFYLFKDFNFKNFKLELLNLIDMYNQLINYINEIYVDFNKKIIQVNNYMGNITNFNKDNSSFLKYNTYSLIDYNFIDSYSNWRSKPIYIDKSADENIFYLKYYFMYKSTNSHGCKVYIHFNPSFKFNDDIKEVIKYSDIIDWKNFKRGKGSILLSKYFNFKNLDSTSLNKEFSNFISLYKNLYKNTIDYFENINDMMALINKNVSNLLKGRKYYSNIETVNNNFVSENIFNSYLYWIKNDIFIKNINFDKDKGLFIKYFFNYDSFKQFGLYISICFSNNDFEFLNDFKDYLNSLNDINLYDFKIEKGTILLSKFYDFKNFNINEFNDEFLNVVDLYETLIKLIVEYSISRYEIFQNKFPIVIMENIEDSFFKDYRKNNYIGFDFNTDDYDLKSNRFPYTFFNDTDFFKNIWNFLYNFDKNKIILVKSKNVLKGLGIISSNLIQNNIHSKHNNINYEYFYTIEWLNFPEITLNNIFLSNEINLWNMSLFFIAKYNSYYKKTLYNYLFNEFINNDKIIDNIRLENQKRKYLNSCLNEIIEKNRIGEDIRSDVWNNIINKDNTILHISTQKLENDKNYYKNKILNFINYLINLININSNQFGKKYSIFTKMKISSNFFKILPYFDNSSFFVTKNDTDFLNILFFKKYYSIKKNKLFKNSYFSINYDLKKFLDDVDASCNFDNNISISDPIIFNQFFNWIFDKNLGNYIGENPNPLPVDLLFDNISEKNFVNFNFDKLFLGNLFFSQDTINQCCASLNAGKHIIFNGTSGTGKTELAIKFCQSSIDNNFSDGYILTTATSDWSTFDTIGGLMPSDDGSLNFYQGKFLEAIAENKWLIIDEINRADIDKAFGQLFTVLSGQDVELPYKINGNPVKIVISDGFDSFFDEDTSTYHIGRNWRIIGTMNVDDKDSLFDLSYAFMRRFIFIEVDLPKEDKFKELIKNWSNDLDDYYSTRLLELYYITEYRKIGPAIFKDMIDYIRCRNELDNNDKKLVLSEAICSYILPQLEGLNKNKLSQISDFFSRLELLDYVQYDLKELLPNF